MGYNRSYKWTKPTYPIYHQGYNLLTKSDEPPSMIIPWLHRNLVDGTDTQLHGGALCRRIRVQLCAHGAGTVFDFGSDFGCSMVPDTL